jgi:hypothetical protein
MTRKQAIQWVIVHTYNGDTALATRVYIENRMSRKVFDEAVHIGQAKKEAADNEILNT